MEIIHKVQNEYNNKKMEKLSQPIDSRCIWHKKL